LDAVREHCFVSSLPVGGTKVLILDGVNNPGFSGGPVLHHTGADQQILAVVSGIVTEPAEVISSLATTKTVKKSTSPHQSRVDTNSGFIVAYSIDTAIDVINKNPIGPLRPAQ
jgi:hypothetical protein